MTHLKLQGKSAIVTNVDREPGREIALALASEGADIMISGSHHETLAESVALIEKLGRRALSAVTDLSDESQVNEMVHVALASFGKVDILVNNAGTTQPADLSEAFLCAKAVIPQMLEKDSGKIVNVGLDSRVSSDPQGIQKVDALWGMLDFSETLAQELEPHHIQVTAICPASNKSRPESNREELNETFDPQQVAAAVVFHCSSEGVRITGEPHGTRAGYAV